MISLSPLSPCLFPNPRHQRQFMFQLFDCFFLAFSQFFLADGVQPAALPPPRWFCLSHLGAMSEICLARGVSGVGCGSLACLRFVIWKMATAGCFRR